MKISYVKKIEKNMITPYPFKNKSLVAMPESWCDIVDQIKRSLTQKKSIGFHNRHALHDTYGCIFKITDGPGPGLNWIANYVSIGDNSIKEIYLGDSKNANKFEIVSRGYMPGSTLESVNFYAVSKGDNDAVKETWRIADELVSK
jgi:hypothetical protein